VSAYLEDDHQPFEQLSFKFQKFQFDTWASIIHLNCLRECLGEGFHIHFVENQLLQDIFDIKLDKDAKKVQMSQREKRKFLSSNSEQSKRLSQNRSKQRSSKNFISFDENL